ncbi:alkaline shock response membrane anchor protein AmaP [Enterococcus pseudoavium]|uniref:Alkaline shock response membrane anchor protein AmaP n=1 Tax=Enterococcus pseudoavium TaxID=44007 RepID=A0AAE4I1W9_9ENTE|nr:alkaline shock response membrane anchor protein AmaP [Enterococcus pseudoavium]MDT2736319.1 alkaline shock response membrane anchor protein AmaP [Enterococcus pseudoavium]MDT2753466.1 alkaline shock response membrane anchor protein AmaP [Enterococcus pseudoavium]MDT2770685.1 alkaline shock response membrane anchor protein AmaP [Enterococcus pseudoavium]REC32334.1 alkaline shock response membrane anchor protein AmaP [Enterococcus pseudoavium]
MNKLLKIILIIFSLVLLSVFLSVAAIYYLVPSNPLDLSDIQRFVLTNEYAQLYLFWAAIVLAILIVIVILMVLFYPKRVTKFILKDNRGQLSLDKRAIEGYVRTSINQKDFMDSPKVNVAATKNRIRVHVRGQLKKTSDLVGRTDLWAQNVEALLQDLLGAKEQVSIKVKFQSLESRKTPTETIVDRPRVE